jgi:hypothetical protein
MPSTFWSAAAASTTRRRRIFPRAAAVPPAPVDPYVPIADALRALGHESPIVIVSRAERVAGDIARAEQAGEEPKAEDLDTAAAISSTLPAVWAFATRGQAGGGDAKSFDVITPDDLPISPEPFASVGEASEARDRFVERFTLQGYYKTAAGERIPVAELRDRLQIVEAAR